MMRCLSHQAVEPTHEHGQRVKGLSSTVIVCISWHLTTQQARTQPRRPEVAVKVVRKYIYQLFSGVDWL